MPNKLGLGNILKNQFFCWRWNKKILDLNAWNITSWNRTMAFSPKTSQIVWFCRIEATPSFLKITKLLGLAQKSRLTHSLLSQWASNVQQSSFFSLQKVLCEHFVVAVSWWRGTSKNFAWINNLTQGSDLRFSSGVQRKEFRTKKNQQILLTASFVRKQKIRLP